MRQERPRVATPPWHQPQRLAVRRVEPDLRAVSRESELAHDGAAAGERRKVARQVVVDAGTHLTDPEVEFAVLIGQERHEFSVRRDLRAFLRALPVREVREARVEEGIVDVRGRTMPGDEQRRQPSAQGKAGQKHVPGTRGSRGRTGLNRIIRTRGRQRCERERQIAR